MRTQPSDPTYRLSRRGTFADVIERTILFVTSGFMFLKLIMDLIHR